ncbi:MAG: deoxyguanosinetriphosphate triphosphohydrolase [Acidocella sp.]|nr:deoxyguanosinetriphosphate triphosphohydrolase [Acidocella sp.]
MSQRFGSYGLYSVGCPWIEGLRCVGLSAMTLAPFAVQPQTSRGRLHAEPEALDRSPFQRDRDRVVHASAFRKLQYKTQVFVTREGDFYRTRLTHSLEVAQVARAIARRLSLDEDLTEALALAHDLGHPPFGHAGETGLNEALRHFGGFDHNAQSLRVVTLLEHKYAGFDGLNLTWEMLEGLAKHNGPLPNPPAFIAAFNQQYNLDLERQPSAEAQVAAFADDIAYNTHDLDDGLRAGLFKLDDLADLPVIGDALHTARALTRDDKRIRNEMSRRVINLMIQDVINESQQRLATLAPADVEAIRGCPTPVIGFSPVMAAASRAVKAFLFDRMYRHWRVNRMSRKAQLVTNALGCLLLDRPDLLPDEWRDQAGCGNTAQAAEIVRDYVAGMTDRFAMEEYARLTDPAVPS